MKSKEDAIGTNDSGKTKVSICLTFDFTNMRMIVQ